MKRFNRARLAWLLALVIGCGESSAASVEIGAAGGEFAPAGTNATLTIPEGALTSNTKLTAEAFATDDIELPERGATVVSQVVRFSPEGVVFAEPATLTFTIDAADLPEGGSPTQLVIARAPSGTDAFELLPTVALPGPRIVATTDRLGDFVVLFMPGATLPCGSPSETTTWLASTDEGTEAFVIGAPLDASGPVSGCFAHAFVAHDGSAQLEFGEVGLDGTGQGAFYATTAYDYRYEPAVAPVARRGAIRIERDPAEAWPVSVTLADGTLTLTYLGETLALTDIRDVVDALDVETMEGAHDVLRLQMLPLLIAQARLLGFGSPAMTQYLDTTARFSATIANSFTVRVSNILSPITDITYEAFVELGGITIDGLQRSQANLSGDGTMEGILDFEMVGRTQTLRGSVDHASLLLDNGVTAGGTYTLSIEGGSMFVLPYTLAADVDLRGVLPISSP